MNDFFKRLQQHLDYHRPTYQLLLIFAALGGIGFASIQILPGLIKKSRGAPPGVHAEEVIRTDLSVEEIVDRVYEKMGGRSEVDALISLQRAGKIESNDNFLKVLYFFKRPNKLRYNIRLDERTEMRVGCDGKETWRQYLRDGKPLPAQALTGLDAELIARNTELVIPISAYFEETRHISRSEDAKVDDHDCFVLKFSAPLQNDQLFFIDMKTFEVRKRTRNQQMSDGESTEVAAVFSDYSSKDGLLLPYREEVTIDGRSENVFHVEEIALNPGILNAFFEKPATLNQPGN